MAQLWDNPIGTDGFEFVEYTAPDVSRLHRFFEEMGFRAVGRHRSKAVTLYRQGDTNFIVNAEPDSHGVRFAQAHGPSACAMAFRVKDAGQALRDAVAAGAREVKGTIGAMELNIPAIEGIGGSLIYLVDRHTGLALGGFDPVAYFTDARAMAGRPGFEVSEAGAVWRFRNEANRAFFLAHPEIYGPQFGGYDPTDVARGIAVAGKPRFWLVAGARLFLFGSTEARDAFAADPARFTEEAGRRWPGVRETLAR